MRLDIRTKLVLVSLGLIAVSILVLEAYLRPQVEQEIVAGVRADLFARLTLIERDVAARASQGLSPGEWDALADEMGARADLRLSLIGTDGAVIGDSEVDASALARVENHGQRAEVEPALRGGRGFAMRASATV
ncbi:MAG: hypothetical protein ABUL77_04200, partial [Bacteroidota bacterium]